MSGRKSVAELVKGIETKESCNRRKNCEWDTASNSCQCLTLQEIEKRKAAQKTVKPTQKSSPKKRVGTGPRPNVFEYARRFHTAGTGQAAWSAAIKRATQELRQQYGPPKSPMHKKTACTHIKEQPCHANTECLWHGLGHWKRTNDHSQKFRSGSSRTRPYCRKITDFRPSGWDPAELRAKARR